MTQSFVIVGPGNDIIFANARFRDDFNFNDAEHDIGVILSKTRSLEAHQLTPEFLLLIADAHETKDRLTQLPNRIGFVTDAKKLQVANPAQIYELALLSVEPLPFLGDEPSYDFHDKLVAKVIVRLNSLGDAISLVGRVGTAEFLLLVPVLPKAASHSDGTVIENVAELMSRPFLIDSRIVPVSAHLGVEDSAEPQLSIEARMRNAELALLRAKADRLAVVYFREQLRAHAESAAQIRANLRGALLRGETFLEYQPILSSVDGKVIGFEALMRWKVGDTFIRPDIFIPIAEESGDILPIGYWLIDQICIDLPKLDPSCRLAINVSPVQLLNNGFVDRLIAKAAQCSISASRIELEITESVLIVSPDIAVANINRLKACGFRISLDDFGTGFSSLSYLTQFSFDTIKIDRTFITGFSANAASRAIISAVVRLGEDLGVSVLAEGVETQEQLDFLREKGCKIYQGYFGGRPQRKEFWPEFSTKTLNDRLKPALQQA